MILGSLVLLAVSTGTAARVVVTDTFVKRKGRWQVVFRRSTPFPETRNGN
jgi:hypothetical protein